MNSLNNKSLETLSHKQVIRKFVAHEAFDDIGLYGFFFKA